MLPFLKPACFILLLFFLLTASAPVSLAASREEVLREQLRHEQLLHDRLLQRRDELMRKLAMQRSSGDAEQPENTAPISLTSPPEEIQPEYIAPVEESPVYESPAYESPPPAPVRKSLRLKIAENLAPVRGYARQQQEQGEYMSEPQEEYVAAPVYTPPPPPEPAVYSPPPPPPRPQQPTPGEMPDPPAFYYGPRPIGFLSTLPGLEVALEGSRYTYHERVAGEPFMNEKGWKIGIEPTYTVTLARDWFMRGDGRFAYGPVDYAGSGSAITENQSWEFRYLVGKDYMFNYFTLAPYTGYGYRFLYDDLRAAGPGGYRRKSTYHYIPIGVTHRIKLARMQTPTRVATNFEYDYLASGRQESYLQDVNPADSKLVNRQHRGDGLRGSLMFEFPVWSVGPWFHIWSIADSDVACSALTCGTEPRNRTVDIGFKVSRKMF